MGAKEEADAKGEEGSKQIKFSEHGVVHGGFELTPDMMKRVISEELLRSIEEREKRYFDNKEDVNNAQKNQF